MSLHTRAQTQSVIGIGIPDLMRLPKGKKMESIVLNGVTYYPEKTASQVKIVILQRGWVMVGRWNREGEMCTLDDASVIRQWGTKKGIGELVAGPTSSTVLDKAGHVEFHILTVVATLDVEESAWSSKLA